MICELSNMWALLQDSFLNPSTKNETPAHVVSRLISLAGDLGLSANAFEAGYNDSATDLATRISFKARIEPVWHTECLLVRVFLLFVLLVTYRHYSM